jgi:hypothetical protein
MDREGGLAVRLFSYKMTHDTGFAPNPFWGRLTLATCKPKIREKKEEGDWIAGFTSAELVDHGGIGSERLVYLMQVSMKLPIAAYFHDPAFAVKIPSARSLLHKCGDNIYRPRRRDATAPAHFEQLKNDHHHDQVAACVVGESRIRDVSGRYVLVAERFVYFGENALVVPADARPQVPRGQSSNGSRTHDEERARRFIEYVFSVAQDKRVVGPPHRWAPGDESWKDGA